MDTCTDTQTSGQAYSPHPPLTPRPAGCWPMDRGHVAGRNASQCWALALADLVLVCLPENYQPGTAHKNKEGVLFSTLLVSQLALLSVPLSCWPQFFLLLAFLVSSGQQLITEFVLLPTPRSVTIVHCSLLPPFTVNICNRLTGTDT